MKWNTRGNAPRLLAFLAAVPAFCHDPITTHLTWTNEISRLVYRHCASCHREGGTAMSLITYDEARPWAKAIRNEVLARRMPPFDAVKGIGEFRDDPSLTPPEMDLFVAWVEGGAPEGLPAAIPVQPVIPPAAAASSCGSDVLQVTRSLTLENPITLCGIFPEGPVEVTARLPDDSVRRLIWIRNFHSQWNRNYVFRNPVVLPRGTQILIYSAKSASARLLITRQQAP